MDSIAPSGHDLATRQDVEGVLTALDAMDQRWDERFAAMEDRITAMDQHWSERFEGTGRHLDEMDRRWQAEASSLRNELLAAFERGINDAITKQTRTLVLSQLTVILVALGLVVGVS